MCGQVAAFYSFEALGIKSSYVNMYFLNFMYITF